MSAKKVKAKTAAGQEEAKVFCPCGGVIVNVTRFENGKLKHFSRCTKCDSTERFPSSFRNKAILKG